MGDRVASRAKLQGGSRVAPKMARLASGRRGIN